ncbi:MAG: hypothetical protein EOO45_00465 [Flavobacterium sp.]|nr:MAG: hypothetical protein EOO45_00465 [Flavobacterium sp.]
MSFFRKVTINERKWEICYLNESFYYLKRVHCLSQLNMNLTIQFKIVVRHIVCITAYFTYEIGMLYAYTGEMVYFPDAFGHLIVNLCLFYTNALLILPYSSRMIGCVKRICVALFFLTIAFLLFMGLKYVLAAGYELFHIETTRPYIDFSSFLRDIVWRFIYVSGLSFGYWFAATSVNKQHRLAKVEQEKLQFQLANQTAKNKLIAVENDLLKSKINFHFLFNTLSYLYDSVKKVDSTAGEALMDLSEILRYSISTPSDGKVRLQEELRYVHSMFKISSLKSGGKIFIDYSVSGRPGNLNIIPMVLVTLCENVLKYAELREQKSPAYFKCTVKETTFTIQIANKKRKSVPPISYGMGMRNTEQRLQIAYPGKYRLDVDNDKDYYQLKLIIQLS